MQSGHHTTTQNGNSGFERRQWIKEIIKRMMAAWGFESKKDLALHLGLNENAAYNWVQNNSIPWPSAYQCSNETGRSMDWIIKGVEPTISLPASCRTKVTKRITDVVVMAEQMKLITEANTNGLHTLGDKLTDEVETIITEHAIISDNQKD